MSAIPAPLACHALHVRYDTVPVLHGLDLVLPAGRITVFVGSNGCGKSTLLKSFARLLAPDQGTVLLNGRDIARQSSAQVARELSMLPQSATAPEGLSVHDLVRLGRYPHQNWLRQWSRDDEAQVDAALRDTGLSDLRHRAVDTLSGGQRQRAWIAMTLAQDAPVMLLDEPTTYLDLAHQIEVLDLIDRLNTERGKTVVMVLHDLNLAARYAHHMVALRQGAVVAAGPPSEVMDAALVKQVFDLDCRIIPDPLFGTPLCVPFGKGRQPDAANADAPPAHGSPL